MPANKKQSPKRSSTETVRGLNRLFGKHLRSVREAAGITQEELGFRCGLHRTFVSQVERGIKTPTLPSLFLIAAALEQRPSDVLRAIEDKVKLQRV